MSYLQGVKTQLKSKRGFTFVGALIAVMGIGFMTTSLIQLSASETATSTNEIQTSQAFHITDAGIEYALNQLDHGSSPDVQAKAFGDGSFSISTDPATRNVSVTGVYGEASRTNVITTNFASDCLSLDTATAYASGDSLYNVKLIKTCMTAATVAKVTVGWNWSVCATAQDVLDDETVDYSDYADPNHPGKILICHVPANDPSKAKTLSVAISGWESGHDAGSHDSALHSMDYLGTCGAREDDEDDENLNCPEDSDIFNVVSVGLNGTEVYNSVNMGAPVGGAAINEEITLNPYDLTANQTYEFEAASEGIRFDRDLPGLGEYTVEVEFADGSTLSDTFNAGTAQ